MNIKITSIFKKEFKKLLKKDKNLLIEYEDLLDDLESNPTKGIKISDNTYKIRIKNRSNNRGKSSSYRVITYTKIKETILLVSIYSKNNTSNINDNKIDEIIREYTSK